MTEDQIRDQKTCLPIRRGSLQRVPHAWSRHTKHPDGHIWAHCRRCGACMYIRPGRRAMAERLVPCPSSVFECSDGLWRTAEHLDAMPDIRKARGVILNYADGVRPAA